MKNEQQPTHHEEKSPQQEHPVGRVNMMEKHDLLGQEQPHPYPYRIRWVPQELILFGQ